MTNKEAFSILSDIMDKRDYFFKSLQSYYVKFGTVPDEYKKEFKIGMAEKFKPWREQRTVLKKIKKAARKASKAPGLDQMTKEAQKEALKVLLWKD